MMVFDVLQRSKNDEEMVASCLPHHYYQIPRVFLFGLMSFSRRFAMTSITTQSPRNTELGVFISFFFFFSFFF